MKIEFKRNEKGQVVAYKDGKPIGKIETMGDDVNEVEEKEKKDKKK